VEQFELLALKVMEIRHFKYCTIIVQMAIIVGRFSTLSDLEPPLNQFWLAKYFTCDNDSPIGNFLVGETQHFLIFTFFSDTLTSLPITETGQTDRKTDGQGHRIKPPSLKYKQIPRCLSPRQDRQTEKQMDSPNALSHLRWNTNKYLAAYHQDRTDR